jgi:glyoxylase-like metal-dependent hydrolase (beta-lactamase superfamily II)
LTAKIHLLDGGQFQQDQSIVTFAIGAGQRIWSQCYAAYIDHPEAKIVIETGMNPELWSPMLNQMFTPKQSEEQKLENALKRIGVKPEEIDILINTHLHADHCSNNGLFKKNATWIVNRNELREALAPEVFEITYFRPAFDVGMKTQLIEGDYSNVVKGIDILDCRGHTPGSLAVAVETEKSGIFLFAGDAAMTKENLWGSERTSPQGWPCAPCVDQIAFMRSVEKMRKFANETKARLMKTCTPVYGHDVDEFAKLKKAPLGYYE